MKKVLSLLVAYVFLQTEMWALSGGPIFDRDGNVWALQSSTESLPLGFTPVVKQGSREIVEHQFMHVGKGSHVKEILRMFKEHGVQFAQSS